MVAKLTKNDRVLAAAGGFTGLWAVTWLGTTIMANGSVVQGGFGLGSVVAAGSLTGLWWKTRAVSKYHESEHDDSVQTDEHLKTTHKS